MFSSAAFADTNAGNLAVVNGDVRIAANEKEAGRAAKPNEVLKNNETIKTGKDSSAKILFTDQSIMDIGPNSALKVSDYALKDGDNRTATFSLVYGKLRALVTKKVSDGGRVQVKSNDAVMGVRGTEFVVDRPIGTATSTSIVVVSGLVQVTPPSGGPAISVGAGQMMVATAQFAQGTTAASASGTSSGSGESTSSSDGTTSGSGNASSGAAVSEVSPEQMQAAVGSARTESNVMVQALDLNNTSGSGQGTTGPTPMMMTSLPPPPPPPPAALPPPPPSLPPGPQVPVGNRVQLTVGIQ